MFHMKKLPAQNTCQFVLCFPVSRVAVLPIKNIEPAIPIIVPIPGLYFEMLKAWSLAVWQIQKYDMIWLKTKNTAPVIVPILKNMNYG